MALRLIVADWAVARPLGGYLLGAVHLTAGLMDSYTPRNRYRNRDRYVPRLPASKGLGMIRRGEPAGLGNSSDYGG
jgi:hypothetical protein